MRRSICRNGSADRSEFDYQASAWVNCNSYSDSNLVRRSENRVLQIFEKANRARKIRKIATFAQQYALINSFLPAISNFSVHKLRELAHVCEVRADSDSRGRLILWLKQLKQRRERNPSPRRQPPRRRCASRRRRPQRSGQPKPVYGFRVLDWALGLGAYWKADRRIWRRSFSNGRRQRYASPAIFFLKSRLAPN